jgi:hypothetical protein
MAHYDEDKLDNEDNGDAEQDAMAALAALLRDLNDLSAYLTERGRHTYELAQRFMENARRNADSRAYDERQATMLEYQQYIWMEIAGRVNKLLVTYSSEADMETGASDEPPVNGNN